MRRAHSDVLGLKNRVDEVLDLLARSDGVIPGALGLAPNQKITQFGVDSNKSVDVRDQTNTGVKDPKKFDRTGEVVYLVIWGWARVVKAGFLRTTQDIFKNTVFFKRADPGQLGKNEVLTDIIAENARVSHPLRDAVPAVFLFGRIGINEIKREGRVIRASMRGPGGRDRAAVFENAHAFVV